MTTTVYNSGISYSQCLYGGQCQRHTKASTAYHISPHLAGRAANPCKYTKAAVCESDPEYRGSGRDLSVTAQYGSCSSSESDRNPSHSSLECELCQQCGANVLDSNHSTYGSSDAAHEYSDASSCESNIFWGGAPDQMCTDGSSDRTSLPDVMTHRNTAEVCDCKLCSRDGNHGKYRVWERTSLNDESLCVCNSESSLNLSELSGCDSIHSSREIICENCNCSQQDNGRASTKGDNSGMSASETLVDISGASNFGKLCSETSHIIAKDNYGRPLPERHKGSEVNETESEATTTSNTVMVHKQSCQHKDRMFLPEDESFSARDNLYALQASPLLTAETPNNTDHPGDWESRNDLLVNNGGTPSQRPLARQLDFSIISRRLTRLRSNRDMFPEAHGYCPWQQACDSCHGDPTASRHSMVVYSDEGKIY